MLDVGCGFGGSSRHIAKMFPNASIEGEDLLDDANLRVQPAYMSELISTCR